MYFNGAHLVALYPMSSVFDGLALNATMCSYIDHIVFGNVAGRDVVPDIETFIPLMERSLAELEAAVRVKARIRQPSISLMKGLSP